MKKYSVAIEVYRKDRKAETVFVEVEAGSKKLAVIRALNSIGKEPDMRSDVYKSVKGVSELTTIE